MRWYLLALKKYAVFKGRARRKEYWMFALFNALVTFAFAFLDGLFGITQGSDGSLLADIYTLATLVPALAVSVRRMHDTDHSGWWLVVFPVAFVFSFREGQHGENRFGPDPKETREEHAVAARISAAGASPSESEPSRPNESL